MTRPLSASGATDPGDEADPLDPLVCSAEEKPGLVLEGVLKQFDYVIDLAQRSFAHPTRSPLTPSVLRDLHRLAVGQVYRCAGRYRNGPVGVGQHVPPEARYVSGLVESMCDYVRENWEEDAIVLSSYVMWRVNWIHPFSGGNGRTSRAASYLVILARHGSLLPGVDQIPMRIGEGRRADYIAALRDADSANADGIIDVTAMADLIARVLGEQIKEGDPDALEPTSE